MAIERERIREERVEVTPGTRTYAETGTHTHYKRAVGVFKRQEDIESIIHDLKDGNYDMSRVSLIARNVEDIEGAREVTEKHGNEAKEGAAAGATAGTVLGGVGGFLVGVGLLAIPGIGPILAAGVEISTLASTAAGAGIGAAAGGIIGALVGMGIPEERAKVYNQRVKAGDHLIMVSGTDDELRGIENLMRRYHVEEFGIYDAPDLMTPERVRTEERVEVAEPRTAEVEEMEVVEERRTPRQRVGSDAYDLTGDGDAEVVIVDNTKNIR